MFILCSMLTDSALLLTTLYPVNPSLMTNQHQSRWIARRSDTLTKLLQRSSIIMIITLQSGFRSNTLNMLFQNEIEHWIWKRLQCWSNGQNTWKCFEMCAVDYWTGSDGSPAQGRLIDGIASAEQRGIVTG